MCKVRDPETSLCSWLLYHNIKKDSYVELTLIPEEKLGNHQENWFANKYKRLASIHHGLFRIISTGLIWSLYTVT